MPSPFTTDSATFALNADERLRLFHRAIFRSLSLENPKLEDSTYHFTIPVKRPGCSSPYAYLRRVLTELPTVQSLAEAEAPLPTCLDPAALEPDPV